MTTEARKNLIISKVRHIQESWLLKSIEKLLSDIEVGASNTHERAPDFSFYTGNISDKVDIEELKKERPMKQLDKAEFGLMADAIN